MKRARKHTISPTRQPVVLTDEARAIHREALLVDGHNDLPDQFRELPTWKEPAEVARLARLVTFLNPGDATTEAGFQIHQSLIGIGSGGGGVMLAARTPYVMSATLLLLR